MAWSGPALVALPCCAAAVLGYVTYAPYGPEAAIVAMAQTLILAARPRLLETLFGGHGRMRWRPGSSPSLPEGLATQAHCPRRGVLLTAS